MNEFKLRDAVVHHPHIMMVDPDEDDRNDVEQELSVLRVDETPIMPEFRGFENGRFAGRYFGLTRPDLIILEIEIPDVAGDVLAQLAATTYRNETPPILFFTEEVNSPSIQWVANQFPQVEFFVLHKLMLPAISELVARILTATWTANARRD